MSKNEDVSEQIDKDTEEDIKYFGKCLKYGCIVYIIVLGVLTGVCVHGIHKAVKNHRAKKFQNTEVKSGMILHSAAIDAIKFNAKQYS